MEVASLFIQHVISFWLSGKAIRLYFGKTRGEQPEMQFLCYHLPCSLEILKKANSREICEEIHFSSFSEKKLTSAFWNEIQS